MRWSRGLVKVLKSLLKSLRDHFETFTRPPYLKACYDPTTSILLKTQHCCFNFRIEACNPKGWSASSSSLSSSCSAPGQCVLRSYLMDAMEAAVEKERTPCYCNMFFLPVRMPQFMPPHCRRMRGLQVSLRTRARMKSKTTSGSFSHHGPRILAAAATATIASAAAVATRSAPRVATKEEEC